MTALHQYIAAIGSFQGILLFLMLFFDRKTTPASKVLGFYCLILGLAFFLPFITFGVTDSSVFPLAPWVFFLPVIYSSLLYLYCKKITLNGSFSYRDAIHLSPLLACYLLNVDTLLFHHEDIRLWIVGASAPTLRIWFSEYVLFIVNLGYMFATTRLLQRYHQQVNETLSNFDPAMFRWLRMLIITMLVAFIAKGVMAFSDFATLEMLIISDALIVVSIYLIALKQWKNSELFVIQGAQSELAIREKSQALAQENSGIIDESTRALIFDALVEHIKTTCCYRDPKLSLSILAADVGVSPHQLSEVLNKYAGQNFNHFINTYRVDEVCIALADDGKEPILEIALQAGFSSKSTFNTIFKKFTGLTPTQYRQQKPWKSIKTT